MKGKTTLNSILKEKEKIKEKHNITKNPNETKIKKTQSNKEGLDSAYKKKFEQVLTKNSEIKKDKGNESNLSDTISLVSVVSERPKGMKTDSTKEIHSILKGIFFLMQIRTIFNSKFQLREK